jgi:hypothetical protein
MEELFHFAYQGGNRDMDVTKIWHIISIFATCIDLLYNCWVQVGNQKFIISSNNKEQYAVSDNSHAW